jgi:hypothetical protein
MRKLLLVSLFAVLSLSAYAGDKDQAAGVIGSGATPSFCDAATCGDLPPAAGEPGRGTGGTGGAEQCYAAQDFNTCIENCYCTWRNNKKKCNSSPWCLSLALSERNACFGACISDWS